MPAMIAAWLLAVAAIVAPVAPMTHDERAYMMGARALIDYARQPYASADFIAGALAQSWPSYMPNDGWAGIEWWCDAADATAAIPQGETCYAGRQWDSRTGKSSWVTGP